MGTSLAPVRGVASASCAQAADLRDGQGAALNLNVHGVSDGREGFDAPDRWAEDAPTLAGLAAASVHGVAALGAREIACRETTTEMVRLIGEPVRSIVIEGVLASC